ncbi:hypothetical protein [Pseudazoarcus pumilus]|uniref:Uncharacterized protein n=1 Tax=Pseudazoarcus pumilus TaxID=2067960 RepID=A0A2I6S7V2_9RHOO|nr:hypothetical protein [Pseudazoarcus pumilus]AUN95322.1 hypothetical protein C0099_10510 [Pseudazoarcus pumilus]
MDADKVRCLVSRGGTMVGMFNLDMISFAGGYYIVFEWEDMPDGNRRPLYMSPIDERFLQVLPDGDAEVTHQYRVSVEDPRPFS